MKETGRWEVNYKRLTVKMSDGSTISGKLNIGKFRRFSDFFRDSEDRFIAVVTDGPQKVTMLNKSLILCAETEE